MAILDIVEYPDKGLRTPAALVREVDPHILRLIDDMAETMYYASGVGLAANQVGILKRVAVIDVGYPQGESNLIVLLNPEIIAATGEDDIGPVKPVPAVSSANTFDGADKHGRQQKRTTTPYKKGDRPFGFTVSRGVSSSGLRNIDRTYSPRPLRGHPQRDKER